MQAIKCCHALTFLLIPLMPVITQAEEIKVAVASNFKETLRELALQFETQSPHRLKLIFASTGKHYAQIQHGAPFDVFLAADEQRPALLEQQGLAVKGSRFTYAIGKLALWSPQASPHKQWDTVLTQAKFTRLALANPRHAPYGKAAREVLQAKNLWQKLQTKLIRGENIAQAYQYVKTGNAQLGFIAWAQTQSGPAASGSVWLIPQTLYSPILQQAVVLRETDATREFMRFLRSKQALKQIRLFGYDTP